MRGDTIDGWLDRLGSSAATPGGGAASALGAAMAAGLVEMVVNLTASKAAYAQHAEFVTPIGQEAQELRQRALELVADDEAAFNNVMAAYRLPKQTEEERAARAEAIETAIVNASRPPLQVAAIAARVIDLAARLPDRSNPNVLSDLGVAASLAVSALESAAINVDVNLTAVKDQQTRDRLRAELDNLRTATETGRRLVTSVHTGLSG